MDFGPLMNRVLVVFSFYCLCAFLFQRIRWRYRNRRGKKSAGFYPKYSSLGNALHVLQQYPEPEVAYVIAEQLDDEADEDDDGELADPTKHLRRQLKRIRNGEPIDRLTILLFPETRTEEPLSKKM
jgi:hypothetical protein